MGELAGVTGIEGEGVTVTVGVTGAFLFLRFSFFVCLTGGFTAATGLAVSFITVGVIGVTGVVKAGKIGADWMTGCDCDG